MGIADRGGYADVAVCVVEPDAALVTLVEPDGVTTEQIEPTGDAMLAQLDRCDARPEAIFVLGSVDDIESIAAAFNGAAVPVITAAQADLALARGAALASAQAVNTLDAPHAHWRMPSRIGTLTSLVAAAAVIFVVSLSAALSLGLTAGQDSAVAQRDTAVTDDQPARVPVAQALPQPPPAAPPVAQAIVEPAAAVPDAIQKIVPPTALPPSPEYVPPAAVYVPPAPPASVPPVPQQPRLRDRIIERIPILNRFHDPQYPSG
jgi:hypothetical protein